MVGQSLPKALARVQFPDGAFFAERSEAKIATELNQRANAVSDGRPWFNSRTAHFLLHCEENQSVVSAITLLMRVRQQLLR